MKEIFKNVREKLVAKYLDTNNSKNTKKFKPRLKARIRKNKQIIGKNIDNFVIETSHLLAKVATPMNFVAIVGNTLNEIIKTARYETITISKTWPPSAQGSTIIKIIHGITTTIN